MAITESSPTRLLLWMNFICGSSNFEVKTVLSLLNSTSKPFLAKRFKSGVPQEPNLFNETALKCWRSHLSINSALKIVSELFVSDYIRSSTASLSSTWENEKPKNKGGAFGSKNFSEKSWSYAHSCLKAMMKLFAINDRWTYKPPACLDMRNVYLTWVRRHHRKRRELFTPFKRGSVENTPSTRRSRIETGITVPVQEELANLTCSQEMIPSSKAISPHFCLLHFYMALLKLDSQGVSMTSY